MVSGGMGAPASDADDILLFQRLISQQNYHINLGNLDYNNFSSSLEGEARVHSQNRWDHVQTPLNPPLAKWCQ